MKNSIITSNGHRAILGYMYFYRSGTAENLGCSCRGGVGESDPTQDTSVEVAFN